MTDEIDISKLPVIALPGSEGWQAAYEWGQKLEESFPGQDGDQLAQAIDCNEAGPAAGHRITDLVMVQKGEHDAEHWIWHVTLDDGTTHVAEGWCDYTGWDCRSDLTWGTP